jgi:hypothetical protein
LTLSLGNAFYRGADCCVLVYDITNSRSFEDLDNWRETFISQGDPKNLETFPFILLGKNFVGLILSTNTEKKVTKQTENLIEKSLLRRL